MSESARARISHLVADITALQPKLDSLASSLKRKLDTFTAENAEQHAIGYWRIRSLCDAVIRVRIFVERNFSHIETLGVLSLCRYTFELVIWLKLIQKDERFSLVYARELLKQQHDLYQDLANHLEREIALYRALGEEETVAHTRILEAATAAVPVADAKMTGRKIVEDMHAASDSVDEKLALNFTIYSDEIKQNGYGFQSHIIQTKALPHALDYAERNRDSLAKFEEKWGTIIKELKLKEWKWKARAAYVDMASEYDFIYSYTSRLLHATPASLSTNQKSLEDEEALMFLRYVATQFRWIIKHTEALVKRQ